MMMCMKQDDYQWTTLNGIKFDLELCSRGYPIVSLLTVLVFFSSPEHKVLGVSFSDQAMSVVHHPSSTFTSFTLCRPQF